MPATHLSIVNRLAVVILSLLFAVTSAPPCSFGAEQNLQPSETAAKKASQGFQATKDTGIQHTVPKKPVRVKLHRNAKGEYSWDLTGDNVDDVVKADKRLRKLLDME